MFLAFLFCAIGLFLLMWSADLLVDNASIVAKRLGVSNLLIGIVIIGFGTSAPEMFVSAVAAFTDKGNLALGNALGSNITNIGLVLGSATLLSRLPVKSKTVSRDIPMVIASGVLATLLILDGNLSHIDGFILLTVLIVYLVWTTIKSEKKDPQEATQTATTQSIEANQTQPSKTEPANPSLPTASLLTIANIALLMLASKLLVSGATTIAIQLGISDLVIGLTIVAIGTSLPELAASISAAKKGMPQIIIGNIIGSNIFNTLGVLGITGAIQTTQVDLSALNRDFPVMFLLSILMLIFAITKRCFSRKEGWVLLVVYTVYLIYLILYSG